MKISPEQLKLYAVTDRSWLKPDETLASVTEELLRAGVSCVQHFVKKMLLTKKSFRKPPF